MKPKLIQANAKEALEKLSRIEDSKEYLRSSDVINLFSISDSTL